MMSLFSAILVLLVVKEEPRSCGVSLKALDPTTTLSCSSSGGIKLRLDDYFIKM